MKKKIFIILGVVSFVFVISIISVLILKKDTKEMFIETKPVVSTLADGTSYIFGADVDQFFKVKADEGFTYKIVDADNNEVKTTVTEKDNYLIINAPAEKYKQGKVYTLTITNGKFEDKDLKEANCVSFSIKREAKQVSKFNSNVKIVSAKGNIVSENEDKITLKSDDKYKNGTIILVSDDYSQKAYKIEKYENGIYILSKPEITEVYDELDYYGSYSLDLSNFEGNKEVEDYLVSKAKSSLVDSLIIPVDAAGKTNVETKWDEKKEELIIKIDLENGAGEKLFNKPFLKYHSLNFEFEYRLKAVANVDVNVFEGIYDLNVSFTIKEVPKVGVTYNNGKVKELQEAFDKYASSENVYDAFKIDYDKLKKDDKKLNQKLGTIPIETPIAGLNFEVGVALIMEFDLKADFSAKLTSTQNIVVGVNTSGIYGSFKTSSDVEASILGEAKMRLGLEGLAGFDLVGIAKLNATLEGGIYGKASIELKNNAESLKSNFNVVVVGEAGTFVTVKANAELLDFKFSHVITEKEVKLADINDLFAAIKGEEKDKAVSKEEKTESTKAEESNKNDDKEDDKDKESSDKKDEEENEPVVPEEPKQEEVPKELTDTEKIARGNIARQKFFAAFEAYANSQGCNKSLPNYKYVCPGVGDLKCYAKKEEYPKENLVRERYYKYELNEWYMSYRGFEKYYTINMVIDYGSNGSISMVYDINRDQLEMTGLNGVKEKITSACTILPVYAVDPLDVCFNKNFDNNYTDVNHIKNVFNQVISNAGITRDELLIDAYIKGM